MTNPSVVSEQQIGVVVGILCTGCLLALLYACTHTLCEFITRLWKDRDDPPSSG